MRGTEMRGPHGIPTDLLDRLVIIRTELYSREEMIQILAVRAKVEGIEIDDASLQFLGEIGEKTSLRHAVQLLTPASMMAKTNGRDDVCHSDIEQVHALFHDAKSSARLLSEQADKYIS